MPEGDTVHKIAAYLRDRLEGQRIRTLALRDQPHRNGIGQRIDSVRAHGKHLFIRLVDGPDPDAVIRSHLGMHGKWHRYRVGEPWKLERQRAGLTLESAGQIYVLFDPEEIEVFSPESLRERDLGNRIGPDLCDPHFDERLILERWFRTVLPSSPVADGLLDQRVASGIGNVYKSEVLFLERIAPFTPASAIAEEEIIACYRRANGLLRANLGAGPRVTRPLADGSGSIHGRPRSRRPRRDAARDTQRTPQGIAPDPDSPLWVYRRDRLPCFECGRKIHIARLGLHQRSTYWCAQCQPEKPLPSSEPAD